MTNYLSIYQKNYVNKHLANRRHISIFANVLRDVYYRFAASWPRQYYNGSLA